MENSPSYRNIEPRFLIEEYFLLKHTYTEKKHPSPQNPDFPHAD